MEERKEKGEKEKKKNRTTEQQNNRTIEQQKKRVSIPAKHKEKQQQHSSRAVVTILHVPGVPILHREAL